MNTFNLTLDLNKSRASSPVRLRQGDAQGTTITALVLDHGATADLTGYTAQFVMDLPDGAHYYRKAASISGNTVTVTIDETQAASVTGRTTLAYFQLLQGSTVKASTGCVTVEVLPDALDGKSVPESYDSAIQDAIDALDAAVEQMPDMVEDVLADHPEWTTTVQDGSITQAKLATDLARDRERLLYRLDNLLTAQLPEGDVATATDAARTPMAGLALYGRSTQDGTPTPSAPVPIVSVEPDSDGNISLLSKRTSDATQQSVTPIPLDGHELRSLPDGTRDEVTVDERGHAVLVQRVGSVDLGTLDWSAISSAGTHVWRARISNLPDGAVQVPSSSYTAVNAITTKYAAKAFAPISASDNGRFAIGTAGDGTRLIIIDTAYSTVEAFAASIDGVCMLYQLATPVTHDLGTIDPVPLCGPDLTAQAIPTAPFALAYERDLNVTLARLESAIATLA